VRGSTTRDGKVRRGSELDRFPRLGGTLSGDSADTDLVMTGRSLLLLGTVVLVLAGCGADDRQAIEDPTKYPLVEELEPKFQRPVTTASGAIVRRPVKPTAYEIEPSPTCEAAMATFHDGSKPAKRAIVIPPAPGLRASAVSERDILIEWSFRRLPSDCRPDFVRLSVVADDHPTATPTTEQFEIGQSGSARLSYPKFLPPPDVAHASASTDAGRRSRTISVLIRR
jgi:hypothetical protein